MQKIKNFLFINTGTKQTIVKNTFWLFTGEIIGRLLRMALIVYVARILGKEGWGVFSYAISLATILTTFGDIKLSTLVTREASQNKECKNHYLSSAFYFKLITLIISLVLVILIAPIVSSLQEANTLFALVALILFFDSLREFLLALNRATERMEHEGLIKIITNSLIVGFGFYFITVNPTPKSLALAYALGGLLGTLFLALLIRKTFKDILKYFKIEKIKEIWQSAWPIGVIAITTGIMFNLDTVMLGWWQSTEQIGVYAASQRLMQFIYTIPSMIALVLIPVFSKTFQENKNKFLEIIQYSLLVMLMIGLPIVIGGIVLSKEIIILVFGKEYIQSYISLSILLPTILAIFPNFIFKNVIYTLDIQKKFILNVIIGVLLNICLNLLFIPRYGITGAAITTVISQFLITILNCIKLKKIQNFSFFKKTQKILLANILLFFIVIMFEKLNVNIILNTTLSVIFYIFILYKMKENSIEIIKSSLTFK